MDGTATEITLDNNGVCNFCHQAESALMAQSPPLPAVVKIGKMGYNCLIGLSGGVDSSAVLHYAVSAGWKPICFTIDNGWNDPKADENIMRMVETLKVPFFRYTIDIEKFRQLQHAFIKAGQKNIEIPTDHILMASTYEMASKYDIKYVLSGGNVSTESIMPPSWGYNARDLVHIKDVYKKMTGKRLKGIPLCSLLKWNWYRWVKGIQILYPLDNLGYNREESIKILEREYGYQPYGDKHCESRWTTWFQNFYLFTKFGIDKRKAHYSSMINSGQMTQTKALKLLEIPPSFTALGIEDEVMKYPKRPYTDFKTDKNYDRIANIIRKWKS